MLLANIIKTISALMLTASLLGPGFSIAYDPNQFKLPEEADVLVVVEGNADKTCRVTVFEKTDVENPEAAQTEAAQTEDDQTWQTVLSVKGNIGREGMSKNRVRNDGTTPVGVWMLNTPFGQKDPMEGFPKNYIKVDSNHVWADDTNKLISDPSGQIKGERVSESNYAGYYDYVLDAGYNKNAVVEKGSALFIHCQGTTESTSSGCIKIPKEAMIELMKLYGKYGDGHCFIAQGITGEIDMLYDKYGTNNGLEAVY